MDKFKNTPKRTKNKSKKKLLIFSAIFSLTFPTFGSTVEAATQTINFSESLQQYQTRDITIANLDDVTSITTDNGDVSYEADGSNLTISVDNGTPTSQDTFYNPEKYSKLASLYKYANTDSFPDTLDYPTDDDGYAGTLAKKGAAYVTSGTYTPGATQTVTVTQESENPDYLPDTYEYNENGMTGSLPKSGEPIANQVDGNTIVQDKKTVQNSKTLNATSISANRFYFDGGTYIQLPTKLNTIGEKSTNITIEGWFELTQGSGGGYAVYGLNGSSSLNDNNLLAGIYSDVLNLDPSSGGSGAAVTGTGFPVDRAKKVHLVWEIDNNVGKLYMNGSLVKSASIIPRNYTYEEGPKLGMEFDGWNPSDFFKGYMYEVRIYNKALTNAEIINNINGIKTTTGLTAEYLFNNGSGNVITDSSGNGNNGTVVGNTVWENYSKQVAPTFPNTNKYDDGSYEGDLNKNGLPTFDIVSGSYTPYDDKIQTASKTSSTNTFPATMTYNSGGYSGTLNKYGASTSKVVSGSYTPPQDLDVYFTIAGTCLDYWYWDNTAKSWEEEWPGEWGAAWNKPLAGEFPLTNSGSANGGYVPSSFTWPPPDPNQATDFPLTVGSYTGWVKSVAGTMAKCESTKPTTNGTTNGQMKSVWGTSASRDFSGTLTKPAVDTRTYEYTQNYSGTVKKPAVDTRKYDYTQNYSGDAIRYRVQTESVTQTSSSFPSTIPYNNTQDGYVGTLTAIGGASVDASGDYTQNYSGRVYSTTVDTRKYMYLQYYSGTVSEKGVDTRIWRQDYEGTVYKGGNDIKNIKYAYNVTLNYTTAIPAPGSCNYKGVSPSSITTTNFKPKCIQFKNGSTDIYSILYDFGVTGISNTGK